MPVGMVTREWRGGRAEVGGVGGGCAGHTGYRKRDPDRCGVATLHPRKRHSHERQAGDGLEIQAHNFPLRSLLPSSLYLPPAFLSPSLPPSVFPPIASPHRLPSLPPSLPPPLRPFLPPSQYSLPGTRTVYLSPSLSSPAPPPPRPFPRSPCSTYVFPLLSPAGSPSAAGTPAAERASFPEARPS